MYKKIFIALFLAFIVFIPSISYSYPRCLDEKNLRKKDKKCNKCLEQPRSKLSWKLPDDAETITVLYKDKEGRIVFTRTLSVSGGYKFEMKVN